MKNQMRVFFDAISENESFARLIAAGFFSQCNPTIAQITDVKTAVSEAVTNAIIHGYEGKGGTVELYCAYDENKFYIEIADHGIGISNVSQAMEPLYTSKPELERSGMGFTIMESFMDEVEIDSVYGLGTKIVMRKKIKQHVVDVQNEEFASIGGVSWLAEISLYDNQVSNIIAAQNGEESAMENLISINNGLIWSIVKRFCGRGFDVDDLYQIAVIGFMRAIKKFDTSFDVKLSTYAVPYILGEIKRYIQAEGPLKVSRTIKELLVKIVEIQKEYLKVGKEPTIEELAKELGTDKEEIVIALESRNNVNSIYEGSKDDDGLTLIERISTGQDEQDLITNKIAIKELIDGLKEREKQVVLLRYFRGKTQTEVAVQMNISQVQVSRIERRVLERMRKKLTDNNAVIA